MKISFKKLFNYDFFFKNSNGRRTLLWLERIKTPSYQKWFIGVGTALILTFLLSPSLQPSIKDYMPGEIAHKEIKSHQDLLVLDEKSTEEKRLEAERSVLSIYDYDLVSVIETEKRVWGIFIFQGRVEY